MYISDAGLQEDVILITGNITEENENEPFLIADQEGIPVVIELKEYVEQEQEAFRLKVPVTVFEAIAVYEKLLFLFAADMRQKAELALSPAVENKNISAQCGLYNVGFHFGEGRIAVTVSRIPAVFKVNRLSVEEETIEASLIAAADFFKPGRTVGVYLARRMKESLWQYRDKKIYLGNWEGARTEFTFSLPAGLLMPEGQEAEYYDFLVEVAEKKMRAEYFLHVDMESSVGEAILKGRLKQEAGYQFYKSAGQNLAVSVCRIKRAAYQVTEIRVCQGMILMRICPLDTDNEAWRGRCEIIFRKRAYPSQTGKYTGEKRYFLKEEETGYLLWACTADFLDGMVRSADELWEAEILKDGVFIPVSCGSDQATGYFEIKGGYKICFFARNGGELSVYTHESAHAEYGKIKAGVLGSCFTRSVFKSDPYFNPDYKRFYDCCFTQFHSSLVSLSSEPFEEPVYCGGAFDREAVRYLPAEFEKSFFSRFSQSGAKYLLLDNYTDATRPLIEIAEGKYLTYNKYLMKSELLKSLLKYRFIKPGTKEYYELYRKYSAIFVNRVSEIIPKRNVILVAGRFSLKKTDEKTNQREEWDGKAYIQKNNLIWDETDLLFRKAAPEARVIDMTNTKYVSDVHSPIPGGASPSHYQRYYYREILDKFNKIVLEDLVAKGG